MDPNRMHQLTQWLVRALGTVALALGCLLAVNVVFGNAAWPMKLQVSNLATSAVHAWVGTESYLRLGQSEHVNVLADLMETFGVPFAQPEKMLAGQLPAPDGPWTDNPPNSQISLVNTLAASQPTQHRITMGWLQYDTTSATIHAIQQSPGVNVICPSWLTAWSPDGTLHNRIEPGVVAYAHKHHIKVWAMVDNQFSGRLTHAVLGTAKTRSRLVHNIVNAAVTGGLDGINLDFEAVQSIDRQNFELFVHQLHAAMAQHRLALSADISPDIVFLHDTDAFFHAGLAADCDYVVLMAYDEHWYGDQIPGPVADVPWVTISVEDLLDTGVPADKIVLGLPLYTVFWHVHADGSVTSVAEPASAIDDILKAHHARSAWIPQLGVAYAKYPKPDGYMEVWYETPATLKQKLALVGDMGLAGVAVWSLRLSDEQTWSTVVQAIRQSVS